jgi:hypothetical protein
MTGSILAQAELESATVANISAKFEENMLGTGILVVSVYEAQKTKIGDGFFKSRKQLVRKSTSAKTYAKPNSWSMKTWPERLSIRSP